MRRLPVFSAATVCALLSACGGGSKESVQWETPPAAPPPYAVTYDQRPASAPLYARRSLGQPRLSALIANQPAQLVTNAPMATYSRYDGRGPGDASVPDGISQNFPIARRLPGQGAVPERDVVDVGLNNPRLARNFTPPAPPQRVAARVPDRRKAPAPAPRALTSSPTPIFRPSAPIRQAIATPAVTTPVVAAAQPAARALPPQPRIAALGSSSLSAPLAVRDTTPTGLPTALSTEQSIPIGALPASLGLANIEAGEASIPTSDTLEQSTAGEGGTLDWTQAAALIRAGEVADFIDIGEFEVLLSLCSGRGVITIQPTPTALADIKLPKVVCGKAAALTSQ